MGHGKVLVASSFAFAFAFATLGSRSAHASSYLASMCSPTETECERGPLAVAKAEAGSSDFDYDTGWVPQSSPIQIRVIVAIHDRTQVDMTGTLDATWPDAITLAPKGPPAQGHISIDDGFEISIQARFTVDVAGQTYSWTGNIPYLPNVNFLASASQTFDPWAFAGGDIAKSTVIAQTATQKIAQVPLTNSIIPIPGISGGFEMDGAATFSAWYDTLRIGFDEVSGTSPLPFVDAVHPSTRLLISPSPSFDTNVFIHGEVTRQVTLHFIPAFYFSILGNDFTLPLADLPLPLPASTPELWDFDPVAIHVPLPEISIPHATIDVGTIPVGVGTKQIVSIANVGEEILAGTVDTLAPMAEIDTPVFSVSPQQNAGLSILLVPQAAGPFDVMLHLGSNDPLSPDTLVHLTGIAGSANIGEPAGCGCSTVGAPSAERTMWGSLAGIALAVFGRRRRVSTRV